MKGRDIEGIKEGCEDVKEDFKDKEDRDASRANDKDSVYEVLI